MSAQTFQGNTDICPSCTEGNAGVDNVNIVMKPNSSLNNSSQPRDTQIHLLSCPGYSEFRGDTFDPSDDKMLAEYFIKVVQGRAEIGVD